MKSRTTVFRLLVDLRSVLNEELNGLHMSKQSGEPQSMYISGYQQHASRSKPSMHSGFVAISNGSDEGVRGT